MTATAKCANQIYLVTALAFQKVMGNEEYRSAFTSNIAFSKQEYTKKTYSTEFHKVRRKGGTWAKEVTIRLW